MLHFLFQIARGERHITFTAAFGEPVNDVALFPCSFRVTDSLNCRVENVDFTDVNCNQGTWRSIPIWNFLVIFFSSTSRNESKVMLGLNEIEYFVLMLFDCNRLL